MPIEGIEKPRTRTRPRGVTARRQPSLFRESEAAPNGYFVSDTVTAPAERHCFVCGSGAEERGLVGSGHPEDWVHPECLAKPFNWDAPYEAGIPSA